MSLKLGAEAPDFEANTTEGTINFYDWAGDSWVVPFSSDRDVNVSKLYRMLPADVSGDPADRTLADNQTVRNVFVIGPDKKVKLILVDPMTTRRNFDEWESPQTYIRIVPQPNGSR
jgi:alkyl hydroperoxide reductase subunit AhpC